MQLLGTDRLTWQLDQGRGVTTGSCISVLTERNTSSLSSTLNLLFILSIGGLVGIFGLAGFLVWRYLL